MLRPLLILLVILLIYLFIAYIFRANHKQTLLRGGDIAGFLNVSTVKDKTFILDALAAVNIASKRKKLKLTFTSDSQSYNMTKINLSSNSELANNVLNKIKPITITATQFSDDLILVQMKDSGIERPIFKYIIFIFNVKHGKCVIVEPENRDSYDSAVSAVYFVDRNDDAKAELVLRNESISSSDVLFFKAQGQTPVNAIYERIKEFRRRIMLIDETELENLKKQLEEANRMNLAQKRDCEESISAFNQQLDALTEENKRLNAQRDKLTSDLHSILELNTKLNAANNVFKETEESKAQHIQSLEHQISDKTTELSKQAEIIAALEQEYAAYKQRAELDLANRVAIKDYENQLNENTRLKEQLKSYKSPDEFDAIVNEREELRKQLEQERSTYEQQLEELKREIETRACAELEERLSLLQDEIKNALETNIQLAKENNELKQALEAQIKEIENMKNQLDHAQAQNNEYLKEIEKYEAETTRLTNEIQELENQLKAKKKEIESLQKKLIEKEDIFKANQARNNNETKRLKEEYDKKIQEYETLKQGLANLKIQFENIIQENENASERYKQEIAELKEKIVSNEEIINQLNEKLSKLQNELTEAQRELTEANKQLEKQNVKLQSNKNEYNRPDYAYRSLKDADEAQLNKQRQENESLKREVRMLKQENDKLREEILPVDEVVKYVEKPVFVNASPAEKSIVELMKSLNESYNNEDVYRLKHHQLILRAKSSFEFPLSEDYIRPLYTTVNVTPKDFSQIKHFTTLYNAINQLSSTGYLLIYKLKNGSTVITRENSGVYTLSDQTISDDSAKIYAIIDLKSV